MNVSSIDQVTVLGAGTMGHGIAEVAAMAGYDVTMHDIKEESVVEGYKNIEWSLKQLATKKQLNDEPEKILGRLETEVDLEAAVASADLVIESVPEHTGLKKETFANLDEFTPSHTVLASNTSSLSITKLAAETRSPERVVGMHFFNPPVKMNLVEVIYGNQTADEIAEVVYKFIRSIGKTPIYVKKDVKGFVSTILYSFVNEAAWIVTEEEATIEQADATMVYCRDFPMGPFELADLIGIDVVYNTFKERGEQVPPIITDKVTNEELGRKTDRGYYSYGGDEGPTYDSNDIENFDHLRIEARMVNEAARLVGDGVASANLVDTGLDLGANFPKGLCLRADEIGLDKICNKLRDLHEEYGEDRYAPADYLIELVEAGKTGKDAGEGFYEYSDEREYRTINVSLNERGILTIELDRPERMNALNPNLMSEIEHVLETADVGEIRCVTFEGAGDQAFSTGADLNSFADVESYQVSEITSMFETVNEFPRPTIAKINGYCLGGGLELALSCDLRIATNGSEFGFPEINLGLLPGGGSGTQRALEVIGEARAKELVFRGHHINAKQAEEWGLINRTVEAERLDNVVEEFVGDIIEGPPIALKFAKKVLTAGNDSNTTAALAMETQGYGLLMSDESPVDR